MVQNLNYIGKLEIQTLQLRGLSLSKFCSVNIRNINVNKIVMISFSEKSKGSNLKESIDLRARTGW